MLETKYNDCNFTSNEYINIWYMNIECEEIWGNVISFIKNPYKKTINDTEQLCVLLTEKSDLLILRRKIPDFIENNLRNLGIICCETYVLKNDDTIFISELILKDNKLINKLIDMKRRFKHIRLMPFGITVYDEEISRLTGISLFGNDSAITAMLNNKVNAIKVIHKLNIEYFQYKIFDSNEEIIEIKKFFELIGGNGVIKESYGASGKALYRVQTTKDIEIYLRRRSIKKVTSPFIMEKWMERSVSYNHQFIVDENMEMLTLPTKKQIIENGIYRGSQFIPIENDNLIEKFIDAQYKIFKFIKENSENMCIVSMDAISSNEGIYPIIDLNVRFSLSTYLYGLKRRSTAIRNHVFSVLYFNVDASISIANIDYLIQEYRYDSDSDIGMEIIMFSVSECKNITSRIYFVLVERNIRKLKELEKVLSDIMTKLNGGNTNGDNYCRRTNRK